MKRRKSNKLKIILPVIIAIILAISVVLLVILIPKKITANNYFNALYNSNHTKQVQSTTITESDVVVYEKIETVVIDGDKTYHKIEEKRLSSTNNLYDILTTEFYYDNNAMYYFEDNIWKTTEFNLEDNLKHYNLKTEYFEIYTFDEEIISVGTFNGNVLNDKVNLLFGVNVNYTNVNIIITVNENFKVKSCNIIANTQSNKNVLITNEYSYNQETVNLPIIA